MKDLSFEPLILPDIEIKPDYLNIDPFDGRYAHQNTAQYLSEGSRISYQAYSEYALVHTLTEFGIWEPSVAKARAIADAWRDL